MKRAIHLLICFAFAIALVAPGCYTMVSHPKDEHGYAPKMTSDCTRCHRDYNDYPYGYYYAPYPDYWWTYEKYGFYYAYPWWWAYYDYPQEEQDIGRGTKFDARTPHLPPNISGNYPFGPDIYIPSGGGIITPLDNGMGGGIGGGNRPVTRNNESRSKPADGDSDSGKETRQSNQMKQSGPKANDSSSTENDGNKKREKPSKKSKVKKARRKGKQ